jgi:hypothetical protein
LSQLGVLPEDRLRWAVGRRTHHFGLLAVMEDKIVALGRFGRTEFAEHKQALLAHLAHPDTLLIDHLLVLEGPS